MTKCFKFEGALVSIDGKEQFTGWTKQCVFKWRERVVVTIPKDQLQHGFVVTKGVCGYIHAKDENEAVRRILALA